MGGRLSMPRGPDGVTEASKPTASPRLSRNRGIINGRVRKHGASAHLDAALLMLLADGHGAPGGLDHGWPPLRLRQNVDTGGKAERAETPRSRRWTVELAQGDTLREALQTDFSRANKDKVTQGEPKVRTERSAEEERLRKMMGKDD
ncbi:hypothetical protein GRF29_8g1829593 [Pseudopithomyces chartarum]|uniref:Uncharacterized protein n=1 Tax=Pseudopithomyces chartarum TaxID=1892770 RepID=A0AAN6M6T1_9PLEO|nr:hypothetical protein GRF29_8g1829593 [Pseudopithomyces chartarum]